MKPEEKPIANPVVVLREEFDDWAVLFNPDTADAVGINPVGVAIWKKLDGSHDLSALVAAVKEEFDDVPETALEELSAFLDELTDQGFIGREVDPGD